MDNPLDPPFPPLRADLEPVPVEHQGRPMMLLEDVTGLDDRPVAVSPAVVMAAALFDGRRRAAEVRALLAREKVILSEEEVRAMAAKLEENGLLETPRAAEDRRRRLEAFRASPVRAVAPARRGWPENALEFGAFLGRFYEPPGGPGQPTSATDGLPAPLGLVSPHIDFFRGGAEYAHAYARLAGRRPPDVVVALGVAHLSPRSPWVMTRKSYQTPLGPVDVDAALYDKIRSALWYDPLEEEWVHAKEHSLEFQAAWLRHVWRSETPKWVPILCSTYERYCRDRAPSSVPTVEQALEAIGGILKAEQRAGRRVMVLAGVDFAHVGRRFGDDLDVTPELEKRIEAADRDSLDKALRLEADPFFLTGVGDGAWRKVCGLSALYTALRWIGDLSDGKAKGSLLAYNKAPDPAGGVVSFAGAVFEAAAEPPRARTT
jgi:AmmeMemoRadiSam system protein B